MDLGHFAANLFEHLPTPFLAHWDALDGRDGARPSCLANVDYSERGGLRGSEAEEHRLRFFGVARHGWGRLGFGGLEVGVLQRNPDYASGLEMGFDLYR